MVVKVMVSTTKILVELVMVRQLKMLLRLYLSKYHTIHPDLPETLPILPIKYCSGRFYFLSNEAIAFLLQNKKQFSKEYLEDYAIGLYLNDTYKDNVLNIHSDQFFKDMF
jgi:hypothetical protein